MKSSRIQATFARERERQQRRRQRYRESEKMKEHAIRYLVRMSRHPSYKITLSNPVKQNITVNEISIKKTEETVPTQKGKNEFKDCYSDLSLTPKLLDMVKFAVGNA